MIPMAKKILVVDDEPHLVRLIQVNLERAGYEVVTAKDGKVALEQVEAEKPDLVVLDITLPDIDGFKVFYNLRENPTTRELHVILLTAKFSTMDYFPDYFPWQKGSKMDFAYLMKPFNPMELISFIKGIFAAQDGADSENSGGYAIG